MSGTQQDPIEIDENSQNSSSDSEPSTVEFEIDVEKKTKRKKKTTKKPTLKRQLSFSQGDNPRPNKRQKVKSIVMITLHFSDGTVSTHY